MLRLSNFSKAISVLTMLFASSLYAVTKDATPPPNLTMRYEGKIYEYVEVKKISPGGVVMKHSKGEMTVPLENVPANVAKPFKNEIQQAYIQRQIETQKKIASEKQKEAEKQSDAEKKIASEKQKEAERQSGAERKIAAERQQEAERLIESKKREEQAALLAKKTSLYPGYQCFEVSVIQVLNEGILAEPFQEGQRLISGPGFNTIVKTQEKSGRRVFIKGTFKNAYDDLRIWVEVQPIEEPYSYTDTRGARRTTQQWQQIIPDLTR